MRLFLGKIAAEVSDRLGGKVVQQVGVFVVADVVEIDQGTHQVIIEASFLRDISRKVQRLLFVGPEVLDEDVMFAGLVVNRTTDPA